MEPPLPPFNAYDAVNEYELEILADAQLAEIVESPFEAYDDEIAYDDDIDWLDEMELDNIVHQGEFELGILPKLVLETLKYNAPL